MTSAPLIVDIERLELAFEPKSWPFAVEKRAEIDAYFAALKRKRRAIWNGRVLLLHRQQVTQGVLRGAYLETDYASFAAWRAWGRPHAGVHDCFAAAAIVAVDGAALLGVMGAASANADLIYFPCGTPDPDDIVAGAIDLDLSVRRELKEETGLGAEEFAAVPGWTMVVDGALIALIKILRSNERAQTLRARMVAHLAREPQPELADIRIVRRTADFDPAMPRFVTAFLTHHFG